MELINKEIWDAIETDLGEITDVEVIQKNNGKYLNWELHYKSNGVPKVAYLQSLSIIVHLLAYAAEAMGVIKKYQYAS